MNPLAPKPMIVSWKAIQTQIENLNTDLNSDGCRGKVMPGGRHWLHVELPKTDTGGSQARGDTPKSFF